VLTSNRRFLRTARHARPVPVHHALPLGPFPRPRPARALRLGLADPVGHVERLCAVAQRVGPRCGRERGREGSAEPGRVVRRQRRRARVGEDRRAHGTLRRVAQVRPSLSRSLSRPLPDRDRARRLTRPLSLALPPQVVLPGHGHAPLRARQHPPPLLVVVLDPLARAGLVPVHLPPRVDLARRAPVRGGARVLRAPQPARGRVCEGDRAREGAEGGGRGMLGRGGEGVGRGRAEEVAQGACLSVSVSPSPRASCTWASCSCARGCDSMSAH